MVERRKHMHLGYNLILPIVSIWQSSEARKDQNALTRWRKGKDIQRVRKSTGVLTGCLSVWELFGGMRRLMVWLEDSVLGEKRRG